jgi:mitochondrial fission protein ELM1
MLQPLFRFALRRNRLDEFQNRRSSRLMARLLFSGIPTGGERPDLTVSAMGRGEIAAAFLRKSIGSVALHIGIPGRMPDECFDFLITVAPLNNSRLRRPSVSLDMIPTPVLLNDVRARVGALIDRWKQRRPRLWAVLVGGDGAGYSYRPDEWHSLAGGLRRLARANGAGLLLTTSRRTGTAAEGILKEGLQGDEVVSGVWYSEEPANAILDYLAAAEVVFCTEDSRSMISDAVAAGKGVYTLRPEKCAAVAVSTEFLALHEARRRIKRLRVTDLSDVDVDRDLANYFQPLTECWSSRLLDALQASLPALKARFQTPTAVPRRDRASA